MRCTRANPTSPSISKSQHDKAPAASVTRRILPAFRSRKIRQQSSQNYLSDPARLHLWTLRFNATLRRAPRHRLARRSAHPPPTLHPHESSRLHVFSCRPARRKPSCRGRTLPFAVAPKQAASPPLAPTVPSRATETPGVARTRIPFPRLLDKTLVWFMLLLECSL